MFFSDRIVVFLISFLLYFKNIFLIIYMAYDLAILFLCSKIANITTAVMNDNFIFFMSIVYTYFIHAS